MTVAVSEKVEHGDRIDLPSDPTLDVAVQPSGAAVSVFCHAVGDEPLEEHTSELADVDGTGEVDIDGDHVVVSGVNYQRMIAVSFTNNNNDT
jgi:hypothetical protein